MTFAHAGQYGPTDAINTKGVPVPGALFVVYETGTQTLATLYTDRTMATMADNPFQADSLGNVLFFTAPGRYDLTGNGSIITVSVYPDPADQGSGSGVVDSVVGGTDISVDSTDPANPIVNFDGAPGGVTAITVATTNGFSGTSSGGDTPALTLETTITGVVKGNGTALEQATPGTDYLAPAGSGAALTGITPTQVGALAKASNLSDVADAGSSRFNISDPILSAAAAVATANLSLSAPGATLDGYTLLTNDEILLTGQSTASQNGIWIWSGASSALVRPNEFPTAGVVKRGRLVLIINGTAGATTLWTLASTAAGLTIDTTAQVWTNIVTSANFQNAIKSVQPNQLAALTSAFPFNGQRATGVGTGVSATDVATLTNKLSDFTTAPTAPVPFGSQRQTGVGTGILSTDSGNLGQLYMGNSYAYVVSGCVWTADAAGSTLLASMTAGTVKIKGILLTVAAVTSRAFTANKDTYVDFTDNGDGTAVVTYTAVANNTTSPALASSGTAYTCIRNAIISSGATSIPTGTLNQGMIGQGNPTAQFAGTVAVASNGANITATTLTYATTSGTAPTGGGWATVAHASGQVYTIAFTSATSTVLSGVTVIGGSGTVSTSDVITGITPLTVADMLGNRINPVTPYPKLIGFAGTLSPFTTTLTSATPLNGSGASFFIVPFLVPPGFARNVKVTLNIPYFASSATAGTTLSAGIYINNGWTSSLLGATAYAQEKVGVTSDGSYLTLTSISSLPAGFNTAQVVVSQGAAGTLTAGVSFQASSLTVELND